MKTLSLVLKGKWFDMIASGEKKEEYRDLSPYWRKRLVDENAYFRKFDTVKFYHGYSKGRKSIVLKFKGTRVDLGNPEWGGKGNWYYYCISLGEIVSKNF